MSSMVWLAAAVATANPAPVTAEQLLATAKAYFSIAAEEPESCPEATGNEIVVCRQLDDPDKLRVPSDTDQGSGRDRYPQPPNVSGLPDCSRGCIKMGRKPRDPLIIDLLAIPEPPPGSDADRIAKGELAAP